MYALKERNWIILNVPSESVSETIAGNFKRIRHNLE